jgi:murein DD-endopeptidase MepM/ murein hydrolase activator NlpD
VIFAAALGIYGQAIIIDHGFGLFSLYGHCSSLDVTQGQVVARGQIIGKTGTTGLAGGDHLHFGMVVGGTFVNPIEWWDAKWIENNITSKLKAVPAT